MASEVYSSLARLRESATRHAGVRGLYKLAMTLKQAAAPSSHAIALSDFRMAFSAIGTRSDVDLVASVCERDEAGSLVLAPMLALVCGDLSPAQCSLVDRAWKLVAGPTRTVVRLAKLVGRSARAAASPTARAAFTDVWGEVRNGCVTYEMFVSYHMGLALDVEGYDAFDAAVRNEWGLAPDADTLAPLPAKRNPGASCLSASAGGLGPQGTAPPVVSAKGRGARTHTSNLKGNGLSGLVGAELDDGTDDCNAAIARRQRGPVSGHQLGGVSHERMLTAQRGHFDTSRSIVTVAVGTEPSTANRDMYVHPNLSSTRDHFGEGFMVSEEPRSRGGSFSGMTCLPPQMTSAMRTHIQIVGEGAGSQLGDTVQRVRHSKVAPTSAEITASVRAAAREAASAAPERMRLDPLAAGTAALLAALPPIRPPPPIVRGLDEERMAKLRALLARVRDRTVHRSGVYGLRVLTMRLRQNAWEEFAMEYGAAAATAAATQKGSLPISDANFRAVMRDLRVRAQDVEDLLSLFDFAPNRGKTDLALVEHALRASSRSAVTNMGKIGCVLNSARQRFVDTLWLALSGNGAHATVAIVKIANSYDFSRDPDVLSRLMRTGEAAERFAMLWRVGSEQTMLDVHQFRDFFEDLSATTESDVQFEELVRTPWIEARAAVVDNFRRAPTDGSLPIASDAAVAAALERQRESTSSYEVDQANLVSRAPYVLSLFFFSLPFSLSCADTLSRTASSLTPHTHTHDKHHNLSPSFAALRSHESAADTPRAYLAGVEHINREASHDAIRGGGLDFLNVAPESTLAAHHSGKKMMRGAWAATRSPAPPAARGKKMATPPRKTGFW